MRKYTFLLLLAPLALIVGGCGQKKATVEPDRLQAPGIERVEEKAPVTPKGGTAATPAVAEPDKEGVLKRIHFDFDKYQIREDMKPVLKANADWLVRHKSTRILIEGHCDERGTEEYNIGLGEKRAQAAKEHLVSLGVPATSIRTISYGKSRPLVRGVDEATWFQNRRSEFVIAK